MLFYISQNFYDVLKFCYQKRRKCKHSQRYKGKIKFQDRKKWGNVGTILFKVSNNKNVKCKAIIYLILGGTHKHHMAVPQPGTEYKPQL